MIGIVGGVGPMAGLDLFKKIVEQTPVQKDQEHAPVILFSIPEKITDRNAFLKYNAVENPAYGVVEVILRMEHAGAIVAGIACNTVHVPAIFSVVKEKLKQQKSRLFLLNMVEEVVNHIKEVYSDKTVGILATSVSNKAGLYQDPLKREKIQRIAPDAFWQERLQDIIFNKVYGIKAHSSPTTERAEIELREVIQHLVNKGAESVVLGCTELPLGIKQNYSYGVPLIDPTRVLAKALLKCYFELKKNEAVVMTDRLK